MNSDNTISVIVPVYNAAGYVGRCIESVKTQTYADWELILVDDGSTDKSGEIIDSYGHDSRIKIYHQVNCGASAARNLALEKASGAFVTFLDADDYLCHDALENLIQEQSLSDSDFVIGDFEYKINNKIYTYQHVQCLNTTQFIRDYLASPWVIVWGGLIRFSLLKKAGIRFPEGVAYSEDFYTILRILLESSSIINCHKIVYHYNRDNELSATHKNSNLKIKNERDVYLRCLLIINKRGLLEFYERPLVWRLLKIEQALIYNFSYFENFRKTYPRKKKHIFSCRFISIKMKVLMWLVLNKYNALADLLLKIRKVSSL